MSIENGANLLYTIDNVYSNLNGIGTNDSRVDKWESNECESNTYCRPNVIPQSNPETTNESRVSNPLHQNPVIFRFKFTEDFMEELYKFSKIHQFDDRKDFKEAWNEWIEENDDLIEEESERLNRLGFQGDILDKMFKSARYYFRKKSIAVKEPAQRRKYITVNKELLDAMDLHIETNYLEEGYQPKTGYTHFCEENEELISQVVSSIIEKGETDEDLIKNKIKKTYKNRYFIITNK